jgi:hypothetical protein
VQGLAGDRHLEELLLVHLQGAVTTTEGDAPVAVADHLDLLVPGGLDVQLDEHVLVVTDARGLHLVEDLAHHLRGARRLADTEDALALAAAAADRLQAHPVGRILSFMRSTASVTVAQSSSTV